MKDDATTIFQVLAIGAVAKVIHIFIKKIYLDHKQKKENEEFEAHHPIGNTQNPNIQDIDEALFEIIIPIQKLISHVDQDYVNDPEYADYQIGLREFGRIVKQELCLSYDREEIDNIDDYEKLLNYLFQLSSNYFDGIYIESTGDDIWEFKISINGNIEILKLDHKYQSWLNDNFIVELNKIIQKYCNGSFHFIEMGGHGVNSKFLGQNFDICFLTRDELFELSQSGRQYILPPSWNI